MRGAPALVVLALAIAMALGTSLLGWVGVPLTGAVAALVPSRADGRAPYVTPGRAGLAGALAWGGFLAAAAVGGRLGPVMALVGGVVGQPGAVVVALTLALPAALAWGATAVAAGIVDALRPTPPDPTSEADPITLPAPGPTSSPGGAADAAPGSPAAATP